MQDFELSRRDGGYSPPEIRSKFERYGVIVLKGFLAPETRAPIRAALTRKLENARPRGHVARFDAYPAAEYLQGDVLSIRELDPFNHVFLSPELVTVVRHVLRTEDLVYFGDSSAQFGQAARGFHKDNVERTNAEAEDWLGDYGVVRVAFYGEDHSRHSGGLKVRLSSHTLENSRDPADRKRISHHVGRAVDIHSEYGDLVLWSMRLTHSGNARRMRLLPSLCLHPRIEEMLPHWLALPEEERRYFMSCAFARRGAHLDLYVSNMLRREGDYRAYFERSRSPAETRDLLARCGVSFVQPSAYYGSVDTDL